MSEYNTTLTADTALTASTDEIRQFMDDNWDDICDGIFKTIYSKKYLDENVRKMVVKMLRDEEKEKMDEEKEKDREKEKMRRAKPKRLYRVGVQFTNDTEVFVLARSENEAREAVDAKIKETNGLENFVEWHGGNTEIYEVCDWEEFKDEVPYPELDVDEPGYENPEAVSPANGGRGEEKVR